MVSWLRGVIPAVITPFDSAGGIDEKALRNEIEYHLGCGATALCAGGSTGEGAGLSRDEVEQLNGIFVDQVRGRVPVIAGIIPDTTAEAIELGLAAKEGLQPTQRRATSFSVCWSITSTVLLRLLGT